MMKVFLKNMITPAQFAKLRGMSRSAVYNHIRAGKIEVVLVGMMQDSYINYTRYKNHPFEINKRKHS